jgi:hypothetical protein
LYYKSLPDYFSAFTTLWIGFNAYYKRRFSNADGDHDKVRSLCREPKHESLFADLMKDNNFGKAVKNMKKELDCRPLIRMDNGKQYQISDEDKMEDVFEVLYIARNNLFHGDKNMIDERDEKIVRLSYCVLSLFMKEIISRNFEI